MARPLTAEMRRVLREKVRGKESSARRATYTGLRNRGFTDAQGTLTSAGWKQAVVMLPLEEQCKMMGIAYEKILGLEISGRPEYAAWCHFSSAGYTGAYCEGGAVLLLIRAAALDLLAKLNTFNSRQDACQRFTEAQLLIHQEHSDLILRAVRSADLSQVIRGFNEIYTSLMVQECYPGLTADVMASLFNSLGSETLAQITEAIMEAPYSYRAGWPDLTMTNGDTMLWAEIKTTDRLHMSQISTLDRMKSLLPGEIRVVHIA